MREEFDVGIAPPLDKFKILRSIFFATLCVVVCPQGSRQLHAEVVDGGRDIGRRADEQDVKIIRASCYFNTADNCTSRSLSKTPNVIEDIGGDVDTDESSSGRVRFRPASSKIREADRRDFHDSSSKGKNSPTKVLNGCRLEAISPLNRRKYVIDGAVLVTPNSVHADVY